MNHRDRSRLGTTENLLGTQFPGYREPVDRQERVVYSSGGDNMMLPAQASPTFRGLRQSREIREQSAHGSPRDESSRQRLRSRSLSQQA